MVTTTTDFDPAEVVAEDVPALTGPRCRLVLAHYEMPSPPKSAKVSDLRKWTVAAIAAGHVEEPEILREPDPTPEPGAEKGDDEEPTTDLEVRDPLTPIEVIPPPAKWQQIVAMGEFMFKSSLCPRGLKNAHDVSIVLLAANDLGIPLTQALDKIHVINGKKGMAGELMVALIRRDGHRVLFDEENDAEKATVRFQRRNHDGSWEPESSATFTIEQAIRANLVGRNPDGTLIARKDGKPLPWELYTEDMLQWRAVARGARRDFADCLGGVSYTPDELGYIDAEDDAPSGRARVDEPTVSIDAQRSLIAERIQGLDDEIREAFVEQWKKRGLKKAKDLTPGAIRTADRLLVEFEAKQAEKVAAAEADVADAEVVEDATDAETEVVDGQGSDTAGATPAADADPESGEGGSGEGDTSGDGGTNPPEPKVVDGAVICRKCEKPAIGTDGNGPYCDDHEEM